MSVGHINADLTLDNRSYVRLTGADTGQADLSGARSGQFHIATNANDVTITVKGGSVFAGSYRNSTSPTTWANTKLDLPAGNSSPRQSYISMHAGVENGAEGSTGRVTIRPLTKTDGYFGSNVLGCFWAYLFYVESSITPHESGYVDLFEVGTDGNIRVDVGTLYVRHAKPVRILFNGGQWHRNNSTYRYEYLFDVPTGKSLILEGNAGCPVYISKRFNTTSFTSGSGGDTYVRGKDVRLMNYGSVFQGYNGYNFYPWKLTAAQKVHWQHTGDLSIWSITWLRLGDDDLLPYGPTHGDIILRAETSTTYQPGNAAGNVGYGCIDLYGTTQHVNSVTSYNRNGVDWQQGLVTNSTPDKASTLVMGSWNNDCTLNARCCEGVTVRKEGTGILSVKSTRGVNLEVAAGRAEFSLADAVPNLFTNVTVAAGATLAGEATILGTFTAHGAAASQPSFTAKLAPGAQIALDGAESVLEVGQLKVDGQTVAAGDYAAATTPWLAAGTVRVLASGPNAAGATYTWKGGADGNSVFSAENWNEGLPDFSSGSAVLDFTTGTAEAVFGADAKVYALHFGARDFALSGAGTVTLFDGGITSGVGTVTLSAPIHAGWAQTWKAPTNAVVNVAGSLSAAKFDGELALDGGAVFHLQGDNSAFHAGMRMRRGTKVRVESDTALGAADGSFTEEATLYNSASTGQQDLQFVGNRTVDTPFTIVNVQGTLNESGKTVVFRGPVCTTNNATEGAANHTNGRLVFEGGADFSKSGRFFFTQYPGSAVVFTNKPVNAYRSGVVLAFNLGSSTAATAATVPQAIFAVPGNKWHTLRLFGGQIVCGCENALSSEGSICFGRSDWTSYNDHRWLLVDLNGHDQLLGSMVSGWYVTPGDNKSTYRPDRFACVTSSVPAKLTLNPQFAPYTIDGAYHLAAKFRGEAALRFAATTSYGQKLTLTQHVSDTKGSLEVSSGTVAFTQGAGWAGSTNVTVCGTGAIELDAASAGTVFGGATAMTVLHLDDDGALNIPAGSTVKVRMLEVNGVRMPKGTYGRAGSGAADESLAAHFTGGGILQVRYRSEPGTSLLLR